MQLCKDAFFSFIEVTVQRNLLRSADSSVQDLPGLLCGGDPSILPGIPFWHSSTVTSIQDSYIRATCALYGQYSSINFSLYNENSNSGSYKHNVE